MRLTLPADDLRAHRLATAVLVEISILAALLQEAVPFSAGVGALVLVPIGFMVSVVRLGRRNAALKACAAAGLLLAFAAFLAGVRGASGLDDTRIPLAALFVWVQVLHSFDVPRRRDLAFSVASSVALIALAGSLAFSTGFLVLFLAFAAAFVWALRTGHDASLLERATHRPEIAAGSGPGWRAVVAPVAATLAMALAALVLMPRFPGVRVASLPFSLAPSSSIEGFAGQVVNPGRPDDDGAGSSFPPDVYPGYGESLDLRVRGRPDDGLAMRVRSPQPSLYRGQVFDTYAGGRWASSDRELEHLGRSFGPEIFVPEPVPRGGREVVQTFYIERTLPNLVFHAGQARELHLPTGTVEMDDFSSFRLPHLLETDTIYSVVSVVPAVARDELRRLPVPTRLGPGFARYLQLPADLPPRVGDLARSVTAAAATPAAKADAVEAWLRANTRYRLDVPPDPPARDPVDVFLFDRREGFCEQIATAMTLMLRASGVPARLVTGFGPGERNLFSGYWEVRNADAHAWVEVWYPEQGWIAYDPTFGVPHADGASNTFMVEPFARMVGSAVPSALRGVTGVLGGSAAAARVLAVGVVAVAGSWFLVSRRRRRGTAPEDPASAAWLRVEAAIGRHELERSASETASEFVGRAGPLLPDGREELDRFLEAFVHVRYGDGDARRLDELATAAVAAIGRARAPVFAVR